MCLAYERGASSNAGVISACDRARVAIEFGFSTKLPMCLAYERGAFRNA
jgi:hypothetical protein